METVVVSFEFNSRAVAEDFCDAVTEWLTEMVDAKGTPRHWFFENASPSLEVGSQVDTFLDYAQAIREDMKYDLCGSVSDFDIDYIIRRYEEMREARKTCTHPYVLCGTVGGRRSETYCTRCGEHVEELMGG